VNKKVIVAIGLMVAIVVLTGGYFFLSSNNYSAEIDGVKASKDEYIFLLNMVTNRMEDYNNLESQEAKTAFWDESSISGNKNIEEAKKKALEELKMFKLQYIIATEHGVQLTDDEISETDKILIEDLKDEVGTGDIELYCESEYGLTVAQFKKIFREISLITKFVEQTKEEMVLTEEEIQNYYNENKNVLETVTIRHILFSIINEKTQQLINDEEKNTLFEKVEGVLKKINNGEDMTLLALEYSDDKEVISNEGQYELDYYSEFNKDIKSWAFKHSVGEIGVVESDFGYHIVKVENVSTYEEIKEKIIESLKEEIYYGRVEEWSEQSQYNLLPNDKVINSVNFPK
jgi:foldase protein PrsA